MASSGDVDNALMAKLQADATLMTLMPDGVHWDEATPGSKRFVKVSLITGEDEQMFGGPAFENALYRVLAVGLSVIDGVPLSAATMRLAEARIHVLLNGGTLTVSGYPLMTMHREEREKLTDPDEADPDLRWFLRGGLYRVAVSVGA